MHSVIAGTAPNFITQIIKLFVEKNNYSPIKIEAQKNKSPP